MGRINERGGTKTDTIVELVHKCGMPFAAAAQVLPECWRSWYMTSEIK
jgi:hypothetical protein